MKTVFEKSVKGRCGVMPAALDVERYDFDADRLRDGLVLPELSEPEVAAHYTALSKRTFGVDDGFYPLGSCTMKYNPKLNEEIAALPGFRDAHPLARADKMQGSLAVIDTLSAYLAGITGMDAVSLQPCAGAHGEFTAMLMVRAYHRSRGDEGRTKVLIPESVPSLIRGAAVTVITLVGYSAMAGALGGGGLGDIAVRYGMYRYEYDVMLLTLVLIVILVQLIQMVFDLIAKRVDKRAK